MSLLASIRDDGSAAAIGPLLTREWSLVDAEQRQRLFDAIALSWLLNARLLPDAETIVSEVAESLALGEDGEEALVSEPWKSMIQCAARSEVERVRGKAEWEIESKDDQIRKVKSELESAKEDAKFLRGENRKTRRDAELEITLDAITVLGITLQELAISSIPKSQDMLDAEARIKLALSTLGVKPFGEIGKTVAFDPSLHEAHQPPAVGTPVRITAPALRYSRKDDTPLDLIRMQVQVEG